MEIITLGTGSCALSQTRFNASVLLETEGELYLMDAGSPVDALLCRAGKDITRLRAVFVTHMHADHVAGLTTLVRATAMRGKRQDPLMIFLPEKNVAEAFHSWMKVMRVCPYEEVVTFYTVEPGMLYRDVHIEVQAIPTAHIAEDEPITFAYALRGEGKKLLYTGDLCSDLHDYPACLQKEYFDLCILEATHYQPEAALPLLHASRLGALVLTHVHTPWQSKSGADALLRALDGLPYPVHLAYDGFTLRI